MKSLLLAFVAAGAVVASGQAQAADGPHRDFGAYLAELETAAAERVTSEHVRVGAGLRLNAKVGPDGRLTAIRVLQTSGSVEADQRAVRAFRGWRGPVLPGSASGAEVNLALTPAAHARTASH